MGALDDVLKRADAVKLLTVTPTISPEEEIFEPEPEEFTFGGGEPGFGVSGAFLDLEQEKQIAKKKAEEKIFKAKEKAINWNIALALWQTFRTGKAPKKGQIEAQQKLAEGGVAFNRAYVDSTIDIIPNPIRIFKAIKGDKEGIRLDKLNKQLEREYFREEFPIASAIGNVTGTLSKEILLWGTAGTLLRGAGAIKFIEQTYKKSKVARALLQNMNPKWADMIFTGLVRGTEFGFRRIISDGIKIAGSLINSEQEKTKELIKQMPKSIMWSTILGIYDPIGISKTLRMGLGGLEGGIRALIEKQDPIEAVGSILLSAFLNRTPMAKSLRYGMTSKQLDKHIANAIKQVRAINPRIEPKKVKDTAYALLDGMMGYDTKQHGLSVSKYLGKKLNAIQKVRISELEKTMDTAKAIKVAKTEMKRAIVSAQKIQEHLKNAMNVNPKQSMNAWRKLKTYIEEVKQDIAGDVEVRPFVTKGKRREIAIDYLKKLKLEFGEQKKFVLFKKLYDKIESPDFDYKVYKKQIDNLTFIFKKIQKENKGVALTPKTIMSYFRRNPDEWKLFASEISLFNKQLDRDALPLNEIFKQQNAMHQRMLKLKDAEVAKKTLLEMFNDTGKFSEEYKKFGEHIKLEVKKRKGVAGTISKWLHWLGRETKLKNQAIFSLFDKGEEGYNMLLSGRQRWNRIIAKPIKLIFDELSPLEKQRYGLFLSLYGKFSLTTKGTPKEIILKNLNHFVEQARTPEESETARQLINVIKSDLDKVDLPKMIEHQKKYTDIINKAFTEMTGSIKSPLGLDFKIPYFLEDELRFMSNEMISNLRESGAFKDLSDKQVIAKVEELRNRLNQPKYRKTDFIKSLKDENIITSSNREELNSIIDDYFTIRGELFSKQRVYNPLIVFNMGMDVLQKNPKLEFTPWSAQQKRNMPYEIAALKRMSFMTDPAQIYTYRFSDFFRRLEQAHIFEGWSKMTAHIGGKEAKFLINPKEISRYKKAFGANFDKIYSRISSDYSKDLNGWYATKEMGEIIEDLVDNQTRANAILRANYVLKLRHLYKMFIMWKNDLTQIAIADPRGLAKIPEAYRSMLAEDSKYLMHERLNLFSGTIGRRDMLNQVAKDLETFYGGTEEVKKLNKFFGGKNGFFKQLNSTINKSYNKVQDLTWTGDKLLRHSLALQFEKNGMSVEDAVKKTQLFMAHYDRLSTRSRRLLSIPFRFSSYRIQMARLHKELITHPAKYIGNITLMFLNRLIWFGALGYAGYKPMRSKISKWTDAEGTPEKVIDFFTQYRYEKVDPKTGAQRVFSISSPTHELDKILNRRLKNIFKYNAGVFPAFWMMVTENKQMNNKPITDVGLGELMHGDRTGDYGARDWAKWIGQVGYFLLKNYFPPIQDVEDAVKFMDEPELSALEQTINFTGLGYIYVYTRTIQDIEKDIKKAVKEGDRTQIAKLKRDRRLRKVLKALELTKGRQISFGKAMEIIEISHRMKSGQATTPEETEIRTFEERFPEID